MQQPFGESPCQQWRIAFIYAFATTFNSQQSIAPSLFKLPDFTPDQLEVELQKEDSQLVHNIICSCLGNIFNRKNPVESYTKSLQDVVTEKIKTMDIELEKNPLSNQKFNMLSADLKLLILYSMIEWQLQDSQAVRLIIDYYSAKRSQHNPIEVRPIGTDKEKSTYWQFGDSPYIWKVKHKKKEWILGKYDDEVDEILIKLVCKDRQTTEAWINTLSTTHRAEKALSKYVGEHVYPLIEKQEKQKAKLEREKWKKLNPVEPVTTRSYTRKRERVNYNYDDIYTEQDFDEYLPESSSRPSSPDRLAKKPTRSSNRLKGVLDA
ncbi:hypothetical protein CU097_006720 [Rhizopus azygosporus]|uniref:WHIM1 domain-containing protein n=2 Tax=Rhizopus TaxID=4842 RepID=A0A367J2F2_RHIAZ|nr:hypothetical protein G6F69_004377 [Rhizopus microsporus]KAG1231640.1 hypothetical protein G6F67_005610 [Rhizopus microsporus]KAG1264035.1 hypothetical protein G6F68_004670 [Rhizopus microsporus]ORE13497.1 hypothetical protein BCV71DRAFT_189053 [Rhizopus microsporus]RCH84112.1 hypothetical protein CU097_006720 [Rhizopus azygosporus]